MKNYFKNLLSKKVYRRVALSFKLSKIKSKVSIWGFRWPHNNIPRIVFISSLTIFLSGYYPTFSIPPVNLSLVSAENNKQSQEIIASSFPQPVILPHPGYLSTKFSRFHHGIDIATSLGTPVHPITQGVVEETVFSFRGYGNHVIIAHPNGFKSLYGHMGKVFAKIGQAVKTDTKLGEVGVTGISSGPHTHLEITHDGEYIDPLLILPEIPTIQSLPPKQ